MVVLVLSCSFVTFSPQHSCLWPIASQNLSEHGPFRFGSLSLRLQDTLAFSKFPSSLVVWLLCEAVSGLLEGPVHLPEPYLSKPTWFQAADRA